MLVINVMYFWSTHLGSDQHHFKHSIATVATDSLGRVALEIMIFYSTSC